MQHARKETNEQSEKLQPLLEQYIARISDELQQLARNGDWEAIRSVFRVLDAHARAKELRAQGQPARAHLWLVGVGRKRQKAKVTKKTTPPQPAA
jgi:hypothetical protein